MTSDDRCPNCGGYRGLPRVLHTDPDNPAECEHEFHKEVAPVLPPEPEPANKVVEMPAPQPQPQAIDAPAPNSLPVCPHCGQSVGIRGHMTVLGRQIEVMVICCRNPECRKILGAFQPLQLQMMPPPGVAN